MPTPVTVIDQSLITQTAATSISQVLNDLPAFRADVSSTTAFVGGGGNAPGNNLIDLRGLGASRTLVLVDGLRYPATTFTGSFNTDLIPSSLVSRIDVVTGGASAAYGSDAVAGVVNIILDHKLEGIRGSAQYGIDDAGDGQDQKYSIAGGHGFFDDKVHVIAGVDYEDRQSTGNCYSRSWCAQEWGLVSNPTPGVNGMPALVIAPATRAAQLTPAGLIVSSKLTAAYGGQQVTANGTGLAPFTFGQLYAPNNNQMVGGSSPGISPFTDAFKLEGPETRWATYLHSEWDITNAIQAWVDVSVGHTLTIGNSGPLKAGNQNPAGTAPSGSVNTAAVSLSINNPFLPAALAQEMNALKMTSVDIGKSGDGLRVSSTDYDDETYRVAGGLKGKIGDWKWDTSYFHGETESSATEYNDVNQTNFADAVQAVNGTGANAGKIVCAVNKSSNVVPACAPLNLFGVGTASTAALNYVYGTAWERATITLDDVSANIQGSPFKTWAGPVSVATGLEYRAESLANNVDPLSSSEVYVQDFGALHGQDDVIEAYGETTVPLLKDMPFAKDLEINAAFRRTQYNLSSPQAPLADGAVGPSSAEFNASTWKLGFVYQPITWLRFRGTLSKDFRAPNLTELYSLPSVGNSAVLDPKTNTNTQVPTESGGNPDLKPEIAYTATGGVTIQPSGLLRNLQITADYYHIKVKDYIAAAGASTLVDECYKGVQSACALVTRNSSGVLTFIEDISANADELEESGYDFELDYRHGLGSIGNLDLRVLATVYSQLTYVTNGSPINGACQNGVVTEQAYPSMPCYEITSRVTFTRGPWLGGVQVRYIPEGVFSNSYVGPQDPGYSPYLSNSISNNRVPAITYVDLNGSYRFIDKATKSLELYGAINNLFNTSPPVSPANNIGANADLYDVIGLVFKVGVRFRY